MSTTLTYDDATGLQASPRPAVQAALPTHGSEFLAFQLGGEEYGLDLRQVQEIRSYEPPARLADAPAGVVGALNLRGAAVPVVDLRQHLGFPDARHDAGTVTLVLGVANRVVGVVVDGVSDVVAVRPKQWRPAPDFHARLQRRHVFGLGALARRMLILVDIEALLSDPALGLIGD
jgi:purine-binding chemotaxis protein CheW